MIIKLAAGAVFGVLANVANYHLLALTLERAGNRPPERVSRFMIKWYGIRCFAFLLLTLILLNFLGWDFGLGVIGGLALSKLFLFHRLFRHFLKKA